jgi:hypothetical protein
MYVGETPYAGPMLIALDPRLPDLPRSSMGQTRTAQEQVRSAADLTGDRHIGGLGPKAATWLLAT